MTLTLLAFGLSHLNLDTSLSCIEKFLKSYKAKTEKRPPSVLGTFIWKHDYNLLLSTSERNLFASRYWQVVSRGKMQSVENIGNQTACGWKLMFSFQRHTPRQFMRLKEHLHFWAGRQREVLSSLRPGGRSTPGFPPPHHTQPDCHYHDWIVKTKDLFCICRYFSWKGCKVARQFNTSS